MKEFRRLDLNSEEMGVPVSRLMANAGRRLADAAEKMAPKGRIVILCGKGNNGGDGYAAARHLHARDRDVACVAVEPPAGRESRREAAALPPGLIHAAASDDDTRALVLDCLLGSGIRGRPRAPYDEAIRWINRQRAPVLACDVPSGLGTDLCVSADRTVTFHAMKQGLHAAEAGKVDVVSIGIPRKAQTHVGVGDLIVGYPVPGADSHKNQNGHVMVVGGGPYVGAPHYAGIGAYRAGADLVEVWSPEEAAFVMQTWGPDLLVHPSGPGDILTPDHNDSMGPALDRATAVLIGPGVGRDLHTREAIQELLDEVASRDLPVVVDADGLDAVTPEWLASHGDMTVLTPHGGEFADLSGMKPTPANVHRYAGRHEVTIVRKGSTDVISDGKRRRQCDRGHPTMTVGGTGDVLAGVIAALLSKGASPFDAGCAGAYMVGVAGEIAASTWSYGASATHIADAVPAVLHRLG